MDVEEAIFRRKICVVCRYSSVTWFRNTLLGQKMGHSGGRFVTALGKCFSGNHAIITQELLGEFKPYEYLNND